MKEKDLKFMSDILNNASWLFYGDLDEYFDDFIKKVFKHDFKEYGFREIKMTNDFAVAYWLLLSELVRLGLVDYGTSPRGAWLTEKGEKFKKIFMNNNNVIEQVDEYIYNCLR